MPRAVIAIVFLVAQATVLESQRAATPQCVITAEEKAVLIAFFKTPAYSKTLLDITRIPTLLASTTQTNDLDIEFINTRLAVNGHPIPVEARKDFASKNRQSCALGTLSGLRNVRQFSADERELRARYGNGAELVRVSRIGFNRDGTVALLHVSVYGATAGGGCLYVFQRRAGQWVKAMEVPTWIT